MKRTVKRDCWFDKQPPMTFIDELKTPLHSQKPAGFGLRAIAQGEADVSGLWLDWNFPDPKGLLETIDADLNLFITLCGIAGDRYPIRIVEGETPCFEAYAVDVRENECVVTAADTEGVRRALIWIEDELRRREGAFLPLGRIEKKPFLRTRITRCFFSPINRPPKYGDELTDDIDYYPEEYLNRLMHDGANAVFIYTRFSDLIYSSLRPEYGKGSDARIEKLNRVIDKLARYGIKVFIFAIEPMSFTAEEAEKYPEAKGGRVYEERYTFCTQTEFGKAFCEEAGRRLFERAPGIAGFLCCTYGERSTGCSATYISPYKCPRCGDEHYGRMLAREVDVLMSGMKQAKPEAELVSWTYGHREWTFDEVREYIEHLPEGVCAQQNFDDMGYEDQLGRERLAVDYWLSYVGPSEFFRITAEAAAKHGKPLFAKVQVCCSHEIASVPYIPVPGILYKKYAGMHELGVVGVTQCWYFGNYPSLMSKAAGELAFEENFDDEDAFLRRLAGIYWGNSRAESVVRAWKLFEKSYRNYPMNVMFSYYGPMHDGPVWKLWLEPKNFSLPRSWQSLDPIDGDRIGECLVGGHTLEEGAELARRMSLYWNAGLRELESQIPDDADQNEELSVARAIGLIFESGSNILEFYRLRDQLGHNIRPRVTLDAMRMLVEAEIGISRALSRLCVQDGRLGYHSEAEGYKFFPEKLDERIEQLEELLETEFVRVGERIDAGLAPLAYYLGEEEGFPHYKMSRSGLENAPWELLSDGVSRFRAAYDAENISFELHIPKDHGVVLAPEFKLLWPDPPMVARPDSSINPGHEFLMYYQYFGKRAEDKRNMWDCKVLPGEDTHLLITAKRAGTDWDGVTPMKLSIAAEHVSTAGVPGELFAPKILWNVEEDPVITLGKNHVSPGRFGWLMP